MPQPFRVTLAGLLSIAMLSFVFADEGTTNQLSKAQLDKWSEYYLARAERYQLRRTDDDTPLSMVSAPVMRWTNLVVSPDITHGECFVWTHDGRPEAFVSLFSYNKNGKRTVAHAWNTLSRHPLEAKYDGVVFWTPVESEVEALKLVPQAPPPAETRARRLLQMRQIARAFTARSAKDDGGQELELRLLATPAYRYEMESDQALDGGLFAFVTGTDPEVLLLIEATKEGDEVTWKYLPLRHSHLTLRVRYRDQPVWESLRGSADYTVPSIQRPYRSQHGVDEQEQILKSP